MKQKEEGQGQSQTDRAGDGKVEAEKDLGERVRDEDKQGFAIHTNFADDLMSHQMVEDARGNIAKDLMSKLPHDNNFKYVLTAGSKGTSVNPATIMVCWGQANVEGGCLKDRCCNSR